MTDTDSFQEQNRKYFNEIATKYDDIFPTMREQTAKIAQTIADQAKLDPEKTSVMEFACGTGLVSTNLVPYVKEIIGVDISEGMVKLYNEKAAMSELSAKKMKAIVLDITKDEGVLEGKQFDVIVCSMSYHHFDDIKDMTSRLASYLVPGTGTLLVVDMIRTEHTIAFHKAKKHLCSHLGGTHDHHSHHDPDLLTHRGPPGFLEPDIRAVFDHAGLADFKWSDVGQWEWEDTPVSMFIAKGTKPIDA